MEIKDQRRLAMWKVVLKHMLDNKRIWQDNVPVSKAVETLQLAAGDADTAIRAQTGTTTGLSEDKDALEAIAISAVLDIAQSTRAYALEENNNTLYAAVNYGKDYLLHLPQNEVGAVLDTIIKAASVYTDDLRAYGVDPGDYNAAEGMVLTYEAAVPTPRKSITDKKAVTNSVPVILKNGRRALSKLDNLIHIFTRVNAAFVAQYRTARVIVDARGGAEHPAV